MMNTTRKPFDGSIPSQGSVSCKRCESYARRLDEVNRDFNTLWDYLVSIGVDPEKPLSKLSR